MANGRLRVILNGGEITASSDAGKRIELYIPSGIEFRMEGDFSNKELTKKDVKNIVNKYLDKVFAQSTPAPAIESTSAPAPQPQAQPVNFTDALNEAYRKCEESTLLFKRETDLKIDHILKTIVELQEMVRNIAGNEVAKSKK